MGLKAKIKNDMWHINYIIPFTAKYLQYGKVGYIKKSLPIITNLKVVKEKGKRDISTDILKLMNCVELDMIHNSSFIYWIDEHKTIAVKGNVLGNFCIDYNKVINSYFSFFADQAINVGGKYGERAKKIQEALDILRKREIETVNIKCHNDKDRIRLNKELSVILEKPAVHFHEGLQRILFFNQYMWQTRHGLNGLGRLDKILGGLYQKDLENNVISKQEAYGMIIDFLNTLSQWYVYKSSSILGDVGQIIVLGGMETDGSYFCNDLTYMFLKAQAELGKPDPKTLIRVSKKMPKNLLGVSIESLMTKTGSPIFSNDDVVIPNLLQFGLPKIDAYSYCVSACWEPFIPGKSLDQNNIKAFDFFKPLDVMLNECNLNDIKDFETLMLKYEYNLKNEWVKFLNGLNEYRWACDPFVSILTEGCNEKASDISSGGAIYNNYGVTSIGMGSTCDTLLNIKFLVFDSKKYTLEELNKHRKNDYKDAESVFMDISQLKHHYAHDDKDIIELVNRIIRISNMVVKNYENPLGGKVKFGLSSPFYIRDAKNAPADIAGRKKGDPYGTHISCTDAPYTEIVNFSSKLDYSGHAFNGNVVDFFVSPSFIIDNTDKFTLFLEKAIEAGFFQMQMNIMDSKTLIDARDNPEKYPGLIVRVWGFSAYFNDLPDEYKCTLIKRALESEKEM